MKTQDRTGVILFTKVPKQDFVKTRLKHNLTDSHFNINLHVAMLKDTILGLNEVSVDFVPILSFYPEDNRQLLDNLIINPLLELYPDFIEKFVIVSQMGEELSERFTHAFSLAFNELKLKSVIIIGSDTPHLQPKLIEQSIKTLQKENKNAIMGPSQNGGFYLLGHNQPFIKTIGSIFQQRSSYGELGNAMNLLLTRNKVHLLPEVTDVDTFDDLKTVRILIKLLSTTSSKELGYYFPYYTHELLCRINESYW
jgi:glycosyltransferase A (GT-A) superfamily protein (DUF2064 family)